MTYPTITYTNLEDFKYLLKSEDLKKNSQVRYFRGQSNSKWNLIPSIFRNIKQNETSIFNFEKLWDKYKKQGFLGMYNKCIDKDSDEYTTISFLQHAISYSPLIDFSSNLVIATFFALNNYKDNDFLKTDSAIFIIEENEKRHYNFTKTIEEFNDDIKNFKIGIYTEGMKNKDDYLEMYRNMSKLTGVDANANVF